MSKKKRKRVQEPESPIAGFLRRHPKLGRRLGIAAALTAAFVALWFIADPLGSGFTAIDANGVEVRAGIIDGAPNASARAGRPAPNFLLPDYDRQAVRLDQFEGKVVFVNFWAAWCEFCEDEMPAIVRVAEKFPDDVVVLALNRGESQGTAEGWTGGHRFPVDLDNFLWLLDTNEAVTRKYRVEGMPQSFVIDRNGIIWQELRHVLEYDEILATVQSAMGASATNLSSN